MKNIILIIILLINIGLICVLTFNEIEVISNKPNKFNPNIIVAIIAGSVTIIGYFITRYLEKKKIIEQQIREQKLPTYEEFISFIFEILRQTKNNKDIDKSKLEEFFWTMNKKSILWLSDKTLKSYIEWKRITAAHSTKDNKTENDNLLVLITLGDLLKDFRKDIGHKNENISSNDILSLFINDLDKYKKDK